MSHKPRPPDGGVEGGVSLLSRKKKKERGRRILRGELLPFPPPSRTITYTSGLWRPSTCRDNDVIGEPRGWPASYFLSIASLCVRFLAGGGAPAFACAPVHVIGAPVIIIRERGRYAGTVATVRTAPVSLLICVCCLFPFICPQRDKYCDVN